MATEPQSDRVLSPPQSDEWAAKAADAVESVVDAVHDKVVRPAVVAGRAVVFGVLIAVVGLVVLILLAVGLVRLLDVYAFDGRVWASDALIGALLCGGGLAVWTRRTSRHAPER
jgi:hypothetical protein